MVRSGDLNPSTMQMSCHCCLQIVCCLLSAVVCAVCCLLSAVCLLSVYCFHHVRVSTLKQCGTIAPSIQCVA
jgi:hypothetical protein